jgi:DNA-binding CsgD family transcriptional regulator
MLQYFSSMMLEMYETAEQVACADFSALYIDLFSRVLSFDVAELGCGYVRERRRSPREPTSADATVLSSSFHLDLAPPAVCNSGRMRQLFDPGRLLGYTQQLGLRQLLLIGSTGSPQRPARWLLLGRRGRRAFTTGAALYVVALWPHVLRCNELCQRRYLAAQAGACTEGGFALVSAHDAVEASDDMFGYLARCEWPSSQVGQLPGAALGALRSQGRYEGRLTRWSLARGPGDASLCKVIERLPSDLLTPAETVTARHYAQGRTHGEIAVLLGVSSNTVRTHLAHVFSKLDIHRKSELPARLR